jgi:LacI family transcriptional regulator
MPSRNSHLKRRRRTTLHDVAREAGVHLSTAAAILNGGQGNSRASEETRARVLQVAERLHYRPNRLAQNLRRQRSLTVGVLAGTVENPFFTRFATLIERFLVEEGFETILSVDAGTHRDDRALIETLLSRSVDGIIFWSERDTEGRRLVEEGVDRPVVVFGHPIPDLDSVSVDWGMGARLAVEHLVSLGRRRLACLIPSEAAGLWSGQWRSQAFEEAARAAGLEPTVTVYDATLGDMPAATAAAADLGRSHCAPDGVFCFNDLVAVGALMGLRRCGLRVPEDVAIAGFDNTPLGLAMDVPLTTLDMPVEDVCRAAVSLVLSRIREDETGPPRHTRFLPRLIIRESTLPASQTDWPLSALSRDDLR